MVLSDVRIKPHVVTNFAWSFFVGRGYFIASIGTGVY